MLQTIAPGAPTRPVDTKVQALQLREACRLADAPCKGFGLDQLERNVDNLGPVAAQALVERANQLDRKLGVLTPTMVGTGFAIAAGVVGIATGIGAGSLALLGGGVLLAAGSIIGMVMMVRAHDNAKDEQKTLVQVLQ